MRDPIQAKPRILFYSSVSDDRLFSEIGFYKTDIQILQDLGCVVMPTNSASRFLRFWEYDIGFFYFWTKTALPAFLAKLFRKKVLITGGCDALDPEYNRSRRDYLVKSILFRLCAGLSDANLIVSEADLRNMRRVAPGVDRKARLIPHSIQFEEYRFENQPKRDLITSICWMGAVSNVKRKGLDKALHALQSVLSTEPNYRFMVIGSGEPGRAYLQDLATRLGIADQVVFAGHISDVEKAKLLRSSKFYFQLSEYEGFGIAAIEALAAGNLVVHSGKGALEETIGRFGYRAPESQDSEAIARFVRKAIRNYPSFEDQIRSGVEHVGRSFSYDVRKSAFSEVLARLGAR